MTVADPYDEIVLRALTGRLLPGIASALGNEVASLHLEAAPPRWRLRSYRENARVRKQIAAEGLNDPMTAAVGFIDVKNFYASVNYDRMAHHYQSITPRAEHLKEVTAWLRRGAELDRLKGLPIGLEASVVLANGLLSSADQLLRDAGVARFVRYTDDSWAFLRDPEDWASLRADYAEELTSVGLRTNEAKTYLVEDLDQAQLFMMDATQEYMSALSDVRWSERLREVARETIDAAADGASISPSVMSFSLGVLRSAGDDHALKAAQRVPALLRAHPRKWGDYLSMLAQEQPSAFDVDWLHGQLESHDRESAATVIHLLRCAGVPALARELPAGFLRQLVEGDGMAPVRAAAAVAWRPCDDWRIDRAVEASLGTGDFIVKRTLVATLERTDGGRKARMAGERALRDDPALEPTVQWALTA